MIINNQLPFKSVLLSFLVLLFIAIVLVDYFDFEAMIFFESFITLIAVFLGAYYAFAFSAAKQSTEERQKDIQNANYVIFALIELLNTLENYKVSMIEPVRGALGLRFLALPPEIIHQQLAPKIQVKTLGFLLSETANVNLLGRLITAEKQYHAIAHNIEKRAEMHIRELQPILRSKGFTEGAMDANLVRQALDERLLISIERATDNIIEAVDKTVTDIEELVSDMNKACSQMFPGQKFLKLVDKV